VRGIYGGLTILKAALSKMIKHEKTCFDNKHVFIPFVFDIFGFIAPDNVVALIYRVQVVVHINIMFFRYMNIVFTIISFAIKKGLAAQLVARLPSTHV